MTRLRWPWHRHGDGDSGALAELAKLDERDAEVERLARELRETQSRNNFSAMVAYAIARRTNGRS